MTKADARRAAKEANMMVERCIFICERIGGVQNREGGTRERNDGTVLDARAGSNT